MSSAIVETNHGQQEGGDTLKSFLLEHKNILKKGVDPIYKVLQENEIDEYEELIEFAETDLRKVLDPNKTKIKIKDVHIGKLINILRNIPESTIYKISNKTEKVVKILVSNEEEQALKNINDKSGRIKQHILTITNTMNELKQNQVKNKDEVDKQLDLVIAAAQKRKQELGKELNEMVQDKMAKLTKQMNDLQNNQIALEQCYNKSQDMLNDTAFDAIKRKEKILENTNQLLNGDNISNIDNFSLITSANMNATIATNNIISTILIAGRILDGDKPKAPTIKVNSIESKSVTLNIKTNESNIIGYKIQYAPNNDDIKADDDMKIDWKIVEINDTNNDTNYQIKSLKPSTNYLFYGFVKSKNGFGDKSQPLTLKTCKSLQVDHWDKNAISQYMQFIDNSAIKKTSIGHHSAFLTSICSSGLHVWTFKVIKVATNDWYVIGIWKIQSSAPPKETYFTHGGSKIAKGFLVGRGCICNDTGSGEGKKYGLKCKDGDIVVMSLNMTKLSVKYKINAVDYGEAFKIEQAQYRAAISMYETGDQIKLIKYEHS